MFAYIRSPYNMQLKIVISTNDRARFKKSHTLIWDILFFFKVETCKFWNFALIFLFHCILFIQQSANGRRKQLRQQKVDKDLDEYSKKILFDKTKNPSLLLLFIFVTAHIFLTGSNLISRIKIGLRKEKIKPPPKKVFFYRSANTLLLIYKLFNDYRHRSSSETIVLN